MADFLDELDVFPAGAHDDQVDAVSGACELLLRFGSGEERSIREECIRPGPGPIFRVPRGGF